MTLGHIDQDKCITVTQLKALIANWPEINQYGEPTEVWLGTSTCTSNQCVSVYPLNLRLNADGDKVADILLGHE